MRQKMNQKRRQAIHPSEDIHNGKMYDVEKITFVDGCQIRLVDCKTTSLKDSNHRIRTTSHDGCLMESSQKLVAHVMSCIC